jgi:hypothetical protein
MLQNSLSVPPGKKLRIGEFLLKSRLIDRTQLDEAIEYQCIYGGKLGTCLIELGFVDEWQFAQLLSKYHNLDYVEPYELMSVPQQIITMLTAQTAIDNQAVPYRINNNRLFVAISDAADSQTIERLTKATGLTIIPLTIPEVRLKMALKKYYGMALPTRYESLIARLNKRHQASQKKAPQPQAAPQSEKHPAATSTPEKKATAKSGKPDLDTRAWPMLGDQEQQGEQVELLPASVSEIDPSAPNKEGFLKRLANISSRDQLAETLISYLADRYAVCALWIVRDQKIIGWKSNIKTDEEFEQVSLELDNQSLLGTAVRCRQEQLAPLDSFHSNAALAKFFNNCPAQGLAIPLAVRERIVCVLYLQADLQKLQRDRNELIEVARKLELAFNMLILKNKILKA